MPICTYIKISIQPQTLFHYQYRHISLTIQHNKNSSYTHTEIRNPWPRINRSGIIVFSILIPLFFRARVALFRENVTAAIVGAHPPFNTHFSPPLSPTHPLFTVETNFNVSRRHIARIRAEAFADPARMADLKCHASVIIWKKGVFCVCVVRSRFTVVFVFFAGTFSVAFCALLCEKVSCCVSQGVSTGRRRVLD